MIHKCFMSCNKLNCFLIDISMPNTPVREDKPDYPEMDVMERALRERQRECEERKKKILEQYSQVSKQQAGKCNLESCVALLASSSIVVSFVAGPKVWV